MSEQLSLPGFERRSAVNFLFFALLVKAENASQIVRLRERLCDESGLRGQRIAADLLHITLHGIGPYDGLPGAVVERAKQAGAAIRQSLSTSPWIARPVLVASVGGDRSYYAPATKLRSLLSISCSAGR
jgi:hypothetical protein